jgi:ElaB/YqjD/DUF883 family membrane-anchored ribosome-binding protein
MESYPNSTTFDDGDVMDGGTDMEQLPGSRAPGTQSQPEGQGMSQQETAARQKAGDVLHNVKHRAERVTEAVKSKVSSASDYVKNAQAVDMWGDVKELARRNPGASMLAVAVIGFAIGRSTSSNRSR